MSDTLSSLPKAPVPSASLPVATRKRVQSCYERGKELAAKKEFGYAHEMFAQCVILDPANLGYVETFLQNARATFGNDKKKVGRLGGLVAGHGLKKAISRQSWQEALKLGIEQLKTNPWHVPALRGLAEVCAALHHNEVELAYLKQALEADPKDADTSRHCARSLARMGQFDQAIACWHRVEKIKPSDREAARMVVELAEQKVWHAAELREHANKPKPHAVTPEPEAKPKETAPQEAKDLQLSQRQLLERAIAENPTNAANYLKLADLLVEDERLEEAENVLSKCLIICGENSEAQEQLETVKSELIKRRIEAATPPPPKKPVHIPWLEITLGFAGVALLLQLIPGLRTALFGLILACLQPLIDFTYAHAWGVALTVQIFILCAIFVVRSRRQQSGAPQTQ